MSGDNGSACVLLAFAFALDVIRCIAVVIDAASCGAGSAAGCGASHAARSDAIAARFALPFALPSSGVTL
jgi:hypothetical protein